MAHGVRNTIALALGLLLWPAASSAQVARPKPIPEPSPVRVQVELRSEEPRLAFHVLAGWRGYRSLCQAPCTVQVEPGLARLALSLPGGVPVDVAGEVFFRNGQTLTGSYVDRSGRRASGVFLSLLSIPLAAITPWVAHEVGAMPDSSTDVLVVGLVGAGLSLLSLVVGLALAASGDEARVVLQ